jgi:hypothetical protein
MFVADVATEVQQWLRCNRGNSTVVNLSIVDGILYKSYTTQRGGAGNTSVYSCRIPFDCTHLSGVERRRDYDRIGIVLTNLVHQIRFLERGNDGHDVKPYDICRWYFHQAVERHTYVSLGPIFRVASVPSFDMQVSGEVDRYEVRVRSGSSPFNPWVVFATGRFDPAPTHHAVNMVRFECLLAEEMQIGLMRTDTGSVRRLGRPSLVLLMHCLNVINSPFSAEMSEWVEEGADG